MNIILDFAECSGLRIRRVFREPRQCLIARSLAEVRPVLRQVAQACQTGAYAAGFVAYEAAAAFDTAALTHSPLNDFPLVCFGLYDAPLPGWEEESASIPEASKGPWQLSLTQGAYTQAVDTLRQAIAQGEAYQMNLTLRLESTFSGSSLRLYEQLRQVQDADFSAWLSWTGGALLSLSPELFFETHGNRILTRPMKGTASPENAWNLAQCPKNRAENIMIVDLLRNDLARIALSGSVAVTDLCRVEAYPTVHQMTSTVTASLKPDTDLEAIFSALFPCGSITGAPKWQAMRWINQLENGPRGAYCGAIGWIRPGGDAQFNVPIRTLWHDVPHDRLRCGVGSGITWESQAPAEWAEIATKTRFLEGYASVDLLETLRLDLGLWELPHYHCRRLLHSVQALGFPALTAERFTEALDRFAQQYPTGSYRVRLRYNRQGNFHLEGFALSLTLQKTPQPVWLSAHPFPFDPQTMRHKTTERSLYDAVFSSQPTRCFDVLLWNERGELTEFTRGNLVLEKKGKKLTPPLSCGLLAGTLRQFLCDQGELEEHILTREDLVQADRLWFINSVRGWVPVVLKVPEE
jgi:para-aminobenzoate synthetase/4-amino-4-deoxychorismate lyase